MFLPILVSCASHLLAATPQKIVGYFPSWGPTSAPAFTWKEIDYSQVTHVCWSFAWPDSATGSLLGVTSDDAQNLDSLVATARAHAVKTMISLGGGGQSRTFPHVAGTDALRAKFCHNVKSFVAAHHLDGADLDWEWDDTPPAADTTGYRKLVRELRDSLGQNLLLTAAMPASDWWAKWMPVAGIVDALDWLGIMTYDMTGAWDTQAGYNSPLFDNPREGHVKAVAELSVSSSMAYWSGKRHVPKSKLLFGQPSYGIQFAKGTAPGAAFSGSAPEIEYWKTIPLLGNWTKHWDDTTKANWATTSTGSYVTWDDPRTAALKARWAKDSGYAGAIVWELSQDYANAGHPILDSLSRVLLGSASAIRQKESDKFRLIRNPSGWSLRLPGAKPGRWSLFDAQARLVRSGLVEGDQIQLAAEGLPRGLHILRVPVEGGTGIVRVALVAP